MKTIINKGLYVLSICLMSISVTACAADRLSTNEGKESGTQNTPTHTTEKNLCGSQKLEKGQECKAVVSIVQTSNGSLEFKIVDGTTGEKYQQCELCPTDLHKKFGNDIEGYKAHCRALSKKRVAAGKDPHCLVDTTMLGVTPLSINQSLSSDCIWFKFGGQNILINKGCLH